MIPTHIKNLKINISFHSSNVGHKFDNFKKSNQFKLLNFEIEDLNINLHLRKRIKNVVDSLFRCLPHQLVLSFFELSRLRLKSFNQRIRNNCTNKFNNLQLKYNICSNPFANVDNSKWLINISGRSIPDRVTEFLSLGEGFALPIQNNKTEDRLNYAYR